MSFAIPTFSRAHVLVVGDIMLDRYWHGGASRISPEAPVPVVHVNQVEDRPGGAANVALNISALGASVDLIGITGEDEASQLLTRQLNAAQVNCYFRQNPDIHTITKLRVISQHQQLIRLDFEDKDTCYADSMLLHTMSQQLSSAGAVIFSDYGKGTLSSISHLIEAAKALHKPILVDPKGTDFSRYRGATLITPNRKEFEAIVGSCRTDIEIEAKGQQLIQEYELGGLLVTRGEHGMSLIQAGQPGIHIPTRAREVFDVTGAGDTVIAVLAACLATNQDIVSATHLANLAAGIVVGKLGSATASVAELRRQLYIHQGKIHGVMTEEELVIAREDAKAHGETVVMTNGCFDILHPGHIAYLQQARALGDRLIVAVNNDDSVKRLKGVSRPINSLDDRMQMLAALACVDWVVAFSEDTPERLISRVLPDHLVKGGDYQVNDIAGHKAVLANNGEVNILNFVEGYSTSDLIKKITSN